MERPASPLKQGKDKQFTLLNSFAGTGGMSFSVVDPKGRFATFESSGSVVNVVADIQGEYEIELTGNDMSHGYIEVSWTIVNLRQILDDANMRVLGSP